MTKGEIRLASLERRAQIRNRDASDHAIFQNFFSLYDIFYRNVCAYYNTPQEVDTQHIIQRLISLEANVYLPVSYEDGNMDFFLHTGETKQGLYGISEPVSREKLCTQPDLVIVPGVAFDLQGNRVGYGKGYFDKFLKTVNAFKVGLCYEEQIFDGIPVQTHDVRMDVIVTQAGIYKTH